jgi:hypothetical protein
MKTTVVRLSRGSVFVDTLTSEIVRMDFHFEPQQKGER